MAKELVYRKSKTVGMHTGVVASTRSSGHPRRRLRDRIVTLDVYCILIHKSQGYPSSPLFYNAANKRHTDQQACPA